MNILVIYDSNYGNTGKVAEKIAEALETKAVKISALNPNDLTNYELIIVGTPIIGWKPTVNMQAFLEKLPNLEGKKVTTFDTRVKLFIHGDAMGKVADSLTSVGATLIVESMAFYVAGPQAAPYLLDGELEKAKNWASKIKSKIRK